MAISEATVLAYLENLAPLQLAESWDNVGILVQGDDPNRSISRVLLTIDLSESVCREAIDLGVEMVVAYHPPIFDGLRRLRRQTPTERVVIALLRAGITVYSPHTALDAVDGGVADWLAEPFAPFAECQPIAAAHVESDVNVVVGAGRKLVMQSPKTLADLVMAVKQHLKLAHVRLARTGEPSRTFVQSVAVCPGAGGGLFRQVADVDLFLTGEMRHHDILAKISAGSAVILTEHTHCERGYLPRLARRLALDFGDALTVVCSENDRDPLEIV